MINETKLSLIIPTLNEEKGLYRLLPKFQKTKIKQIIIVDGGSKDKTISIAQEFKATIISEHKKGYGLALRTGFDQAKYELVGCIDGDGTYPVEALPLMVDFFKKNNLDFLVACRFPLKNSNAMKVKNFFGNLLISAATSLIFKKHKTDVCSGMWIMSKATWNSLRKKIKDNGWFFSNEIKIEAMKNNNIRYEEYWIELKKRSGETKVGNVWFIGLKVLMQTIYKRFV